MKILVIGLVDGKITRKPRKPWVISHRFKGAIVLEYKVAGEDLVGVMEDDYLEDLCVLIFHGQIKSYQQPIGFRPPTLHYAGHRSLVCGYTHRSSAQGFHLNNYKNPLSKNQQPIVALASAPPQGIPFISISDIAIPVFGFEHFISSWGSTQFQESFHSRVFTRRSPYPAKRESDVGVMGASDKGSRNVSTGTLCYVYTPTRGTLKPTSDRFISFLL